MHRLAACACAAALVLTAAPVLAAPADAAFQSKPKTNEPFVMQFEDIEVGDLARAIEELTGKRFVIASPKISKVRANVVSRQKITAAEAYQVFLAVLAANGLTVVPKAGFLEIIESQDSARHLTPLVGPDVPPEDRYVTRIHRVAHLSAEEVSGTVLAKLQTKDATIIPYGQLLVITETAANIRRMLEILDVLDQAGETDKIWLRPLAHVPSAQVDKELSEMLGLAKGKDASSPGSDLHIARIVALERPNAIVVVGTKVSFDRVSELLDIVDVAPSNEVKVHVVPLQNADAKKIVVPINDALGGNAAAPARPAGAATSAASTVLEAPVKVSADETTNALIVSATPADFAYVREVIRALDKPKRQVFIEAAILDISAERGMDLGVAWHGGDRSDSPLGPTGAQQTTYGGFRATTSAGGPSVTDLQAFALGIRGPEIPFANIVPGISTIPSFGAFLHALATMKGADILSTPSVIASDNTPAELKVQLQTSLQPNAPTLPSLAALGGAGAGGAAAALGGLGLPTSGNVTASYRGIGPRVKVTPHLNDSDEVRLDVDEAISDVQNAPEPGNTFGTISYIERTVTTTLTVKDGHSVVIGGLMRNRNSRSETKVPLLGDIPVLGALFRTRSDTVEKSNLVLVLTPHILRDEGDMQRVFQRKMDERQELIDHEAILQPTAWSPPHDWKKTRGILAEIRGSYAKAETRERELAALAAKGSPRVSPAPVDLPVPQGSPSSAPPSPPTGKPSPPARPATPEP